MSIPISVIIITKNEEKNIYDCLNGLKEYSEIFVIDSFSIDKTKEIASSFANVKIINFKWKGQYPKKKQWSLDNVPAKNDWILLIDADEIYNDKINNEIAEKINKTGNNAFYICSNVFFQNHKLNYGRRNSKISLFKKGYAFFPEINDLHIKDFWEVEGHYQPTVNGKIGKLKNTYDHNNKNNFYNLMQKHDMYSTWQANIHENIYGNGLRGLLKKIFLNSRFTPLIAFIDSYFFKIGFLDGYYGYAYAKFRYNYYLQTYLKRLHRNS